MKWWGWWHRGNGKAAAARAAEDQLAATQRRTAYIERMAPSLANLPDDELAERLARAFRRRPA